MNTIRLFLFFLWVVSPLFSEEPSSIKNQILFFIHKGDVDRALQFYTTHYLEKDKQDFEILQQLGLSILQEGARSRDAEVVLLSLFGAGISTDERVLPILEEGLDNDNPQLQLASLHFLASLQNDEADDLLKKALGSPYVLLRLEAAHELAAKKHASAVGQVDSLMAKVDPIIKPVFPRLFAMIGTDSATKALRRLMNDPDENVRVEAILSAAEFGRDDLLPQIRILATHHNTAQQEACAIALGKMKDTASLAKLERLTLSQAPQVRLAAHHALATLGKEDSKRVLAQLAMQEDIFAITLLGEYPGSEKLLQKLLKTSQFQVRVNAALALLERKDPSGLSVISELLIQDSRDLAITRMNTLGRGLTAWRVTPSAQHNFKDNPIAKEISFATCETILRKAIDLPEKDFLELAQLIFDRQQNNLIPTLVSLLENLHSSSAIELLKKQQQKIGAPLIRNYCTLALYRMKVPGNYAESVRDWVIQQHHIDLIRFRPLVPADLRFDEVETYQLTPEEMSRLLVESIEALARAQDAHAVSVLLHAIEHGNAKNKYALAGLLMRATQ